MLFKSYSATRIMPADLDTCSPPPGRPSGESMLTIAGLVSPINAIISSSLSNEHVRTRIPSKTAAPVRFAGGKIQAHYTRTLGHASVVGDSDNDRCCGNSAGFRAKELSLSGNVRL